MSQESFIEQTRASYRVWWAQRSWKASIRGNACYHPESSMYPSWNWTKYEIKWEVEIPRNINSKSQFYVSVRSWQMLKRRIKVNRGTFQANNINYILLEILKNSTKKIIFFGQRFSHVALFCGRLRASIEYTRPLVGPKAEDITTITGHLGQLNMFPPNNGGNFFLNWTPYYERLEQRWCHLIPQRIKNHLQLRFPRSDGPCCHHKV